jgi:hypothetical protein
MKRTRHAAALRSFIRIFIGISFLLIASQDKPAGFCFEKDTRPANESTRVINGEEAVHISREYLGIENTKNFQITIKDKVITADTFNTYRALESGIKRLCWVVTFIVPNAVGSSRTVYVDKESGEILGGYSSK